MDLFKNISKINKIIMFGEKPGKSVILTFAMKFDKKDAEMSTFCAKYCTFSN